MSIHISYADEDIKPKRTIIFHDSDGSVYESPNSLNFKLIAGSGDWSVYKETEPYDGQIQMSIDGIKYGMFNSTTITEIGHVSTEPNRTINDTQYREYMNHYSLTIGRETVGNALILDIKVPEPTKTQFSITTVEGQVLYIEDNIKLTEGDKKHFIDLTGLPTGRLIINMKVNGISLSTKHYNGE